MPHLRKLLKRKAKATTNALPEASSSTAVVVPETPILPENELGCTVIYEGDKPLLADLVFVHGLGGHPVKSWSKNDVYWPRDLLGPGVPNTRILTFGYIAKAATIVGAVSANNIHDHAKALVSDLRRQRKQEEETTRPIIFMAHSLGGIVVKDALEYSRQNVEFKPQLASIYLATYGVVFFGTPHRGSQTASLGVIAATACKAVGKETNTNLLRSLETSSETLERISEAFAKIISRREIKVHSFLEEFSMSSLVGKVVEDFSGRIGDAYEGEDRIPADHREMIKFMDVHDIGYRRVLDVVEGFVDAAAEAAKAKNLPQLITANGL
ncbi:hypothetical protein K440DRAFT_627751 [Wilcoxina mikolae CBS 423.85]|nr:hypothetical protein K440DRAFT_627751 [Wilcoxina mikolae CBS 423.85]